MPLYLALIAVLVAAPAGAAEPGFALEPGLELHFAVKEGVWFDGKDGKPEIARESDGSPKYEKSDLSIYVLGQQPDSSFRVLMKRTSVNAFPILTWADLFADGRLTLIPSATPILEFDSIRAIFPLLPKNNQEKKAGWEEIEPRTEVRMRFTETDGVIKAECEGPLDRVARGRWAIRYRLDSKTHLPIEINTEGRWDKYKETHAGIITLTETLHHDKGWVAKFSANAAKYFEAVANQRRFRQRERVALAIAEREKPGAAEILLEAEKTSLLATREAVTESLFRADLDQKIKQCDEFRTSSIESAQQWAKFAGLPAPKCKVTDLRGKEHSLEQYRGQVVVLDFWFRGCSFCIRAMPQVEQAASKFRQEKEPVSFFGVSVDKEETDAKFVADTMKLTYPVIRSDKLAGQFGVTIFPTLLVIAPDGTIQGIFVGHSLTLREDLTSCIQGLLDKK